MTDSLGGQFRFKVGDRVIVHWPSESISFGRVQARTVDSLGKVYQVVSGVAATNLGYLPESWLSARS